MRDAKPFLTLLLLSGLAALWVVGWWSTLEAPYRLRLLQDIARREQANEPVPPALVAQGEWLLTHRLARAQQLVGILVLASMIGIAEGWAARRQDWLGGFHLLPWTLGVMGLAVLCATGGGYLLAPWPWSLLRVGQGGSVFVGGIAWLLARGKPFIG